MADLRTIIDPFWELDKPSYIPTSQKAAANGVATLGADVKIPTAQLPALSITETFVVNSQAAMLALTAQIGDVAVRTDESKTYILAAEPASTLINWVELLTPAAPVQSVNGQVGNVVLTTTNIAEGTNLYYTDARARLSLSQGTGINYNNISGVITNSAPDQTVVLTEGAGISITGTYPSFTIANSGLITTPDLQAVTDVGNTTTNYIGLTGLSDNEPSAAGEWLLLYHGDGEAYIKSVSKPSNTLQSLTIYADPLFINANQTNTGDFSITGSFTLSTDAPSTGAHTLLTRNTSTGKLETIPSFTYALSSLNIATTSPLQGGGDLTANRTLSILDAAADGTTKGAATFTAADFNSSAGLISIDYTNGQAASTSTKGFLTSADWNTFNGKQAALSGTGLVKSTAGTISYITDSSANWDAAYNDKINSASFSAGTLTLTQQDTGTVTALINDATTAVKGISSYNASDFNVTSGAVTIDYTNGQAASGSAKGFLTSADWTTFNNKIGTLNTLTASTQTFATGTTGTDFNISSVTSTHTFNIPDASASNRGVITTGTQTIAGAKTLSGNLTLSSVPALGTAATTFLTTNSGVVSSRTVAQVLSDIGAAPASASGNYIQNQIASAQSSSNFWISGSGIANTSLQTRVNGSNTFLGQLTLFNGAATRGANFQLDASANSGLNLWVHDGSTWVNRMLWAADGTVTKFGSLGNITMSLDGARLSFSRNNANYLSATDAAGFLIFETSNTERARIDVNGNLGIGTSSPGSALHVVGASRVGGANCQIRTGELNATTSFIQAVDIAGSTGRELAILTGGSEVARILTSGNVGIGTASASAKLHVNGAIFTNTTSAEGLRVINDGGFINYYNTANSTRTGYLNMNTVGGAILSMELNQGMSLRTNATERLYIEPAGFVGIGIHDPTTLLEVNGTITAPELASPASSDLVLQASSGQNVLLATNATTQIQITSGGEINVGTPSSPFGTVKLNVGGNIQCNDAFILSDGTTNAEFGLIGPGAFVRTVSNHPLQFRTNDTIRATINATGEVGIGTVAATGMTLDVGGPARVTGFTAAITSTATNLTLTSAHHTVRCTASGITITLPAASSHTGRMYVIMNYNSGGSITTSAFLNLSAVSTTSIINQTSVIIQSDGTNWYQIK